MQFKNKSYTALHSSFFLWKDWAVHMGVKFFIDKRKKNWVRSNLLIIFLFIFFFKKLLTYLFLAALGLHWCRLFSICGEWGLLSSRSTQASHYGGFSCCRAPGSGDSVVAARGLFLLILAFFSLWLLHRDSQSCLTLCNPDSEPPGKPTIKRYF